MKNIETVDKDAEIKQRINDVSKMIAKLLDISQDEAKQKVYDTFTGEAIKKYNYSVMYESLNANVYDIIEELKEKQVINAAITNDDIIAAYYSEILHMSLEEEKQKESIASSITDAIRRDAIYHCVFWFSVPKYISTGTKDFLENSYIKEIISILDKNHVSYHTCDTVAGSFNLNRDYIETEIMDATVTFSGVYPIHWDVDSILKMENMEYNGDIMIVIAWFDENGEYIDMNH